MPAEGILVWHRQKLHSTNTVERLNKEVKRRADVVGIFPGEASIIRLIGAGSQRRVGGAGKGSSGAADGRPAEGTQTRYMQVEAMAELLGPTADRGQGQTRRHHPDYTSDRLTVTTPSLTAVPPR